MARTYYSQILHWDWDAIVESAKANPQTDYSGETYGYEYLGSVLNLAPSGKYYMPWCSNQTADDVRRDSAFFSALDRVASKYNGWIESGEGDPLDQYFVIEVDSESDDEEGE